VAISGDDDSLRDVPSLTSLVDGDRAIYTHVVRLSNEWTLNDAVGPVKVIREWLRAQGAPPPLALDLDSQAHHLHRFALNGRRILHCCVDKVLGFYHAHSGKPAVPALTGSAADAATAGGDERLDEWTVNAEWMAWLKRFIPRCHPIVHRRCAVPMLQNAASAGSFSSFAFADLSALQMAILYARQLSPQAIQHIATLAHAEWAQVQHQRNRSRRAAQLREKRFNTMSSQMGGDDPDAADAAACAAAAMESDDDSGSDVDMLSDQDDGGEGADEARLRSDDGDDAADFESDDAASAHDGAARQRGERDADDERERRFVSKYIADKLWALLERRRAAVEEIVRDMMGVALGLSGPEFVSYKLQLLQLAALNGFHSITDMILGPLAAANKTRAMDSREARLLATLHDLRGGVRLYPLSPRHKATSTFLHFLAVADFTAPILEWIAPASAAAVALPAALSGSAAARGREGGVCALWQQQRHQQRGRHIRCTRVDSRAGCGAFAAPGESAAAQFGSLHHHAVHAHFLAAVAQTRVRREGSGHALASHSCAGRC
jgi:hypothetical protein